MDEQSNVISFRYKFNKFRIMCRS